MIVRVFDIETNGFLPEVNTVWCIACRDLHSRQEAFFGPDEIDDGIRYLMDADIVVGHNILAFDLPVLKHLYPHFEYKAYEDTLIISRLYNPDREGGHSLDAWGQRLGRPKPEHYEWDCYSDAMRHRCIEDVRINVELLHRLVAEAGTWDWAPALRTEYDVQLLQNRIEDRGFCLDIPFARKLLSEMSEEQVEVDAELRAVLPVKIKPGTTVDKPFKLDGDLSARAEKWVGPELAPAICGPFSKVEFEPFNLGSPQQVTEFLLSQGWEPTEFNYKKAKKGGYELNPDGSYVVSSPKLTEDSLDSIKGPAGRLIAKHRVLGHRIGLLSRVNKKTKVPAGWLNEVRPDGRVEAQATPLGTNTGRYTHKQIVNIPKASAKVPYGIPIRSCLVAGKGYVLCGTDASGLEARVAGHYTAEIDGGAYARELLEGDIHSSNAALFSEAAGKEISRDLAKTIYYGLLYGAQARKVASVMGVSFDRGLESLEAFWDGNPALYEVSEAAKEEARWNGYVSGLDGRKIIIRSPHSAMNALFQSAGAILCKNAFVMGCREDDPWHPVCTMHDEIQVEVLPEDVYLHTQRWQDVGRELTERFNMRVPIEFETKSGLNYAQTH